MIDNVASIVLPVLGSLWILYIVLKSMMRLGLDSRYSPKARLLANALYLVLAISISLLGGPWWSISTLVVLPLFGYWFYCRNRTYIAYYMVQCTILLIVDVIVPFVITILLTKGILYFNSQTAFLIGLQISLRLVQYGILKLTTLFILAIKKKQQVTFRLGLNKSQFIRYLILPLFSMFYLYTLIFFMNIYMSNEILILCLINFFLLAALNLYVAHIMEHENKNNALKQDIALYQQQVDLQTKHYQQLEASHEATRGLIHDMRNHLQALERLYITESHRSTAQQYTQDLLHLFNQLSPRYYCQNTHINMMLNEKVDQMHRLGIQADVKIGDLSFDFMRPVDMTTIFSNILDNALEASPNHSNSTIKLRVTKQHHWVSITLINPTHASINKDNHTGLGLKNVNQVVMTYQGNLDTEWRDGYFYTRILLSDLDPYHTGSALVNTGLCPR